MITAEYIVRRQAEALGETVKVSRGASSLEVTVYAPRGHHFRATGTVSLEADGPLDLEVEIWELVAFDQKEGLEGCTARCDHGELL